MTHSFSHSSLSPIQDLTVRQVEFQCLCQRRMSGEAVMSGTGTKRPLEGVIKRGVGCLKAQGEGRGKDLNGILLKRGAENGLTPKPRALSTAQYTTKKTRSSL